MASFRFRRRGAAAPPPPGAGTEHAVPGAQERVQPVVGERVLGGARPGVGGLHQLGHAGGHRARGHGAEGLGGAEHDGRQARVHRFQQRQAERAPARQVQVDPEAGQFGVRPRRRQLAARPHGVGEVPDVRQQWIDPGAEADIQQRTGVIGRHGRDALHPGHAQHEGHRQRRPVEGSQDQGCAEPARGRPGEESFPVSAVDRGRVRRPDGRARRQHIAVAVEPDDQHPAFHKVPDNHNRAVETRSSDYFPTTTHSDAPVAAVTRGFRVRVTPARRGPPSPRRPWSGCRAAAGTAPGPRRRPRPWRASGPARRRAPRRAGSPGC
jgi:hypothetical protein